jgi:hypothetical protein
MAVRIRQGVYGKTKLDGVVFAAAYWWPKAIHEGNGIVRLAIDEKATPDQRQAILNITRNFRVGRVDRARSDVRADLVSDRP